MVCNLSEVSTKKYVFNKVERSGLNSFDFAEVLFYTRVIESHKDPEECGNSAHVITIFHIKK